MKIEQIKTADLIPYARNSRSHSESQVSQIAGSIREFGFTNPVLIDADNGIIAGHGRVMAAGKLGMEKVPCIRLAHLTDTQRRAYIIADNSLALNAGWNEEMLALEVEELRSLNFDIDLLGLQDSADQVKDPDVKPDVEFSEELLEEHNYIVLYFTNSVDWLQAETVFNLPTRKWKGSKEGHEQRGIGRVIDGSEAIKSLIGQ